DGVPGLEMAEEMESLARELLPLASPIMDHLHQRFLSFFVEQDVIGHMESDLEGDSINLGRLRVAIAFADLAGYTRLTEEAGEEGAAAGQRPPTRPVVDHAGDHLEFEQIGTVRLKGFTDPTELFVATAVDDE